MLGPLLGDSIRHLKALPIPVGDVLVDADLFRRLQDRGQARGDESEEDFDTALRLVEGPPFSDVRETRWSWLLDAVAAVEQVPEDEDEAEDLEELAARALAQAKADRARRIRENRLKRETAAEAGLGCRPTSD